MNKIPKWLEHLDDDDLMFIKRFILASGSLKEMASIYEVTYPTVRLRMDKLIAKVKLYDESDDTFIAYLKQLTLDQHMSYETAKKVAEMYRKTKGMN
ncbi:MAG: DUF2089 family protein [Candidatus Izemoplasmataceae bacterium]